MVPDFLVVGHVTQDLEGEGFRLGGTASYASATARRLGLKAGVLTSAHPGLDLALYLPGVQVVHRPSPATTTFVNRYLKAGRTQRLQAVASPISLEDLPPGWRRCPIVLLGPVAQEVDPLFARAFPQALLGISPQGWMRHWDEAGTVRPMAWDGKGLLEGVHVVVLSEEDLPASGLPQSWLDKLPVLILTQGREGALMHCRRRWFRVPPFAAREVDPTGAGDVFAAAYLVRYHESGDPYASALFASCAASLSLQAPGLEGVPGRARIEEHLRQRPQRRVSPL